MYLYSELIFSVGLISIRCLRIRAFITSSPGTDRHNEYTDYIYNTSINVIAIRIQSN